MIEHDVFRFEVPVNDPVGVKVTEGQGDLTQVEATNTRIIYVMVNVRLNKNKTNMKLMTVLLLCLSWVQSNGGFWNQIWELVWP